MSFAAIIANTSRVVRAAGFTEADYSAPIDAGSRTAVDRFFQVDAPGFVEVLPRLSVADNRRAVTVAVRVAYFCGGGNAGGQARGGDRQIVNARAIEDLWVLAALLENPVNYDSQATGIRRVTDWSVALSAETNRLQVYDLTQRIEWEELVDLAAVLA